MKIEKNSHNAFIRAIIRLLVSGSLIAFIVCMIPDCGPVSGKSRRKRYEEQI